MAKQKNGEKGTAKGQERRPELSLDNRKKKGRVRINEGKELRKKSMDTSAGLGETVVHVGPVLYAGFWETTASHKTAPFLTPLPTQPQVACGPELLLRLVIW